MKDTTIHKTVLLQETVLGLNAKDGDVLVDGTLGGGGHANLATTLYPHSPLYAFDLDGEAIERVKQLLPDRHITYIQANVRGIQHELEQRNVSMVKGIMLDLGFSSDQLENAGRGFSFLHDEPLRMTLSDKDDLITAEIIVNEWSLETLTDIIFGFGEEKYARRIAKAIVDAREKAPITTTFGLRDIIVEAVPFFYRKGKIHPATKTFQALRIAVNEELEALRDVLRDGFELLSPGGRMSVISFHSLEDRIVKRFFREKEDGGEGVRVNKKPITATKEELLENRRARSAKLRIIEKL